MIVNDAPMELYCLGSPCSLMRLLDLQGLAVPIESWDEVALDVNTPEALLRAETLVRLRVGEVTTPIPCWNPHPEAIEPSPPEH